MVYYRGFGSGCGLFKALSHHLRGETKENMSFSVTLARSKMTIKLGYLPNTSQKPYHLLQICRRKGLRSHTQVISPGGV
jgi:hypothetical protein